MKPFYEDEEYLILFSEISYIDKETNKVYLKNKVDEDCISLNKDQREKLVKKYKKWLLSQFSSTTQEISLQWVKVTLKALTT